MVAPFICLYFSVLRLIFSQVMGNFFFFLISKCVLKNLYNLYIYYIIKKKKKKNKSNNTFKISLLRFDFCFLNKRNKKKITF